MLFDKFDYNRAIWCMPSFIAYTAIFPESSYEHKLHLLRENYYKTDVVMDFYIANQNRMSDRFENDILDYNPHAVDREMFRHRPLKYLQPSDITLGVAINMVPPLRKPFFILNLFNFMYLIGGYKSKR